MKNPTTSVGIEHQTFRLATQCLNQLRHCVLVCNILPGKAYCVLFPPADTAAETNRYFEAARCFCRSVLHITFFDETYPWLMTSDITLTQQRHGLAQESLHCVMPTSLRVSVSSLKMLTVSQLFKIYGT